MSTGTITKFMTGSVGYIQVTSGQTASYPNDPTREMNAITAVGGDVTANVVQYENFYSGAETVADGTTLFGKFKSIEITAGTARVYSTGGVPTIV